jgi:hypothetical protein
MEVTPEQRNTLLSQKRTADHMFRWVYDVLNSNKISVKQYNVLIKIHDMTVMDQAGYIIHEDTLYPVPRKVKKYQKTTLGWKVMNRFTAPYGQAKRGKKDK